LVVRTEFGADVLEACCADKHAGKTQFRLLSAPPDGEAALRLNLTQVSECLDQVRNFSPCWIVDLPRQLDRHLVTMLDRCSAVLIVFEPTLTGLGAARRWLRVVDGLGYARQKINLVINRSGSKLKMTEQEISLLLEGMNVFKLPNAFSLAEEAAAEGIPAAAKAPKSAYARAIDELANKLMASAAEAQQ
jgi:pilus assembly protein CpaE